MMAAPLSLMAQKHAFSNGLYWELNGTTLTISGNGPMKDYSSPWEGKGTVEKVVIENGVTSIGKCSFWEHDRPHYLKSVVIGNSVKSIGESAFTDCSNLTSVSIPNSVTSIGEWAFSGCSSLTFVSIPNSVTSIENAAFYGCSSLTSIQSLPISVLVRGEKEWDRIYLPKEAVYKYIAEHRNEERIRPIALAAEGKIKEAEEKNKEAEEKNKEAERISSVKAKGGYSSALSITNENMIYYIVGKNGRYGLVNGNGQEIVPAELDAIQQCGTGFLRFKVNGYWGVMNYAGKIIIPTDRGYTKIGDYVSFTKRFAYEMDGYKGECNSLGQQVSKIKVAAPKPSTTQASSSSSSSSSRTTSSSSGSSSNSNSGNKTTTVVVEHHRDPVPVQQWQACFACGGMGTMGCDNCGGGGTTYIGNSLYRCSRCNGRGIIPCNVCYGNKGQYITVYQ